MVSRNNETTFRFVVFVPILNKQSTQFPIEHFVFLNCFHNTRNIIDFEFFNLAVFCNLGNVAKLLVSQHQLNQFSTRIRQQIQIAKLFNNQ